MTDSSHGHYPGKSTVSFLPIIDMDPTDLSCIYLTITFIIDQANSLEIQTPVITFDQPLWLKANEIVQTKELNVVLMLGGFPTMMSFMGSIGHLMEGFGLSEALQNVHVKTHDDQQNSVKGRAWSLFGVLKFDNTRILQELFPAERCRFPHETTEENKQDMHDKENEEFDEEKFDEDSDYDEDGEDLQTEMEEKMENNPHMLLTDQTN